MKQRVLLSMACALSTGAAQTAPTGGRPAAFKPNIILVLADDLGGRENGCYGNTFNESPHIDQLATEGVKFTQAYSSAPVCSPTRASIMTGQNPARHGITDFLENGADNFLDPTKVVALPRVLKAAGYRTGIVGKWHLTSDFATGKGSPTQHGFDEALLVQTSSVGGGDYRFPYAHISGVTQRIFPEEYLTDRQNLEALDFIDRNKGGPFLLYLAHYSVHKTLDAPDSLVNYFNDKRGTAGDANSTTRNPVLAAMLKKIDYGVGQIGAKLKALGLDSNTIVIFASDNGGDVGVTDNAELRFNKGFLYEGGIRVPLVARWPGRFPAGRSNGKAVVLTDLFPTFAALAGASLPPGQPLDGVNLEPLLRGTGDIAPRSLVWHYPQSTINSFKRSSAAAILDASGRKLIRDYDTDSIEVYNLGADISETKNLAPSNPVLTRSLDAELYKAIDSMQWDYEFRDDFNDKDADGWSLYGGAWSPSTGAFTVDSGDGNKAVTEDRYFSNVLLEADVTPGKTGNAGLLFRESAAATGRFAYRGYYAYLSVANGRVELSKSEGGAATLLGQKTFPAKAGTIYRLRVVARGADLKVFVNDTATALITATDSAFAGGLIGVRAHSGAGSFDNIYAKGLRPAITPLRVLAGASIDATDLIRMRRNGSYLYAAPAGRAKGHYTVRGARVREAAKEARP